MDSPIPSDFWRLWPNSIRCAKKLLESQLGDVRPLISEQAAANTGTEPVAAGGGGAASKMVTLNGKQVPTTDPKPINQWII